MDQILPLVSVCQIGVRNSVFSREFAHKFPLPGGNLKISEGIWKFPEGEARGKFSNSRGYFQIHDGLGNLCANSREKPEFLANFFNNLGFSGNIYNNPAAGIYTIFPLREYCIYSRSGNIYKIPANEREFCPRNSLGNFAPDIPKGGHIPSKKKFTVI